MKCFGLLIAIIALVSSVLLFLIIQVIVKNRFAIKKWWKKYNIKKFLVSVLIPALLSLSMSVAAAVFSDNGDTDNFAMWVESPITWFWIAMCIISAIIFWHQFLDWKKDCQDKEIEWRNMIYSHAYLQLYAALKAKTTALRTSSLHTKHGKKTKNHNRYDVFNHIRTICDAFREAIADMTDIPMTHIDVSFIYHYTYEDANEGDKEWRWITGKDSNFHTPLNDFVQRKDNLYHHIISSNKTMVYYNDKNDAFNEGNYYFSSKDNLHNHVGSLFAAKFSFSSNADSRCEGIIMITTYGHKFIKDGSEHEPIEFGKIIEHDIFPCYKNLLKTEMAELYFRHKTEKMPGRIKKAFNILFKSPK